MTRYYDGLDLTPEQIARELSCISSWLRLVPDTVMRGELESAREELLAMYLRPKVVAGPYCCDDHNWQVYGLGLMNSLHDTWEEAIAQALTNFEVANRWGVEAHG